MGVSAFVRMGYPETNAAEVTFRTRSFTKNVLMAVGRGCRVEGVAIGGGAVG